MHLATCKACGKGGSKGTIGQHQRWCKGRQTGRPHEDGIVDLLTSRILYHKERAQALEIALKEIVGQKV